MDHGFIFLSFPLPVSGATHLSAGVTDPLGSPCTDTATWSSTLPSGSTSWSVLLIEQTGVSRSVHELA